MPLRYFFILFMLVVIGSCKKTGTAKPGLKLISISPTEYSRNDLFQIDLQFTNGDNDVNDTLYMLRHVLNLNQQGLSTEFTVDSFPIPTYPGTHKGDLQLNFIRQLTGTYTYYYDPATNQNDTAVFSFVIKNSHGLASDTVRSGQIVILAD
ncbi:MAG TPA: hypothetical protein VMT76_16640 [Puia sp.]|nr:hypothetical protein [Puia sp.]